VRIYATAIVTISISSFLIWVGVGYEREKKFLLIEKHFDPPAF
jgi:hypothetical protein